MAKRHMTFNVQGALNLLKHKHGNSDSPFDDDNGKPIKVKDARDTLREYLAKGYKFIPNDECEGFDVFGGGCPGHEIPDGDF